MRICKKDYDDDRAKQYGPLDRWHHLSCFAKNRFEFLIEKALICTEQFQTSFPVSAFPFNAISRESMMFFTSADNLAGLNTLGKDDQVLLETL